ncbi:MAG: FxsA family protein [bacterium]|nr:FxsA family protein [bacterium]
MFFYLLLLFTLLPMTELVLLIKIGHHIGLLNTILIVIATGISGASLARWQGLTVIREVQNQLSVGIMPKEEILDGIMILAGGLLLLTPGLITDFIGLVAIVPVTRKWIKYLVKKKLAQMIDEGRFKINRF